MARTVRATITVPGPIAEAEAFWYDTSRWPTWVDGLAHVHAVEGDWPHTGGKVIWDSTPAGRGRVVERVRAQAPREGQAVEVEDENVIGHQEVRFGPAAESGRTAVELTLTYETKRRNVALLLTDLLFVRRAMEDSLRSTLRRFAIELTADREDRRGP